MNVRWFGSLPTTELALDLGRGTFLRYVSLCLLQLVCCYCDFIPWGASITTTDPFILSVLKGIPSGGSVSYEHTVWHSQGFMIYTTNIQMCGTRRGGRDMTMVPLKRSA